MVEIRSGGMTFKPPPKVILDNYDALSDDPEVQESLERVMEWEEALIEFLKEWQAVSMLL